ncbi:MAG: L,D-transpeptidase family protein [Lachnospiraceae bacterium]|nr:L,D-transpeptidase family protein [Lachnospiraceae bacterium]
MSKKKYFAAIVLFSLAFIVGKVVTEQKVYAGPEIESEETAMPSETNPTEQTMKPVPTPTPTAAVTVSFSKTSYVVPYDGQKKITAKVKVKKGKKPKLVYRSSNKKVAKVNNKGEVKGISVGTAVIKAEAKGVEEAQAYYVVQVRKESKGWHKDSSKKKYYVNKKGKRLRGYKKISGTYYYFNEKTTYAVRNKWKYVKIKGKKYKVYFGNNGKQVKDPSTVLGSDARYYIYVSLKDNMVTIYAKDGDKGYIIPVKAMVCSVGMRGHETRMGTYSLRPTGRWHVLRYNSNGQYATRYSGPYMFHSVTYDRLGDRYSLQVAEYKKLGKAASHGCIRLQVADAKWIYDHAYRSTVTIQEKVAKGPFRKPKPKKVKKSAAGYYDPTDPSV